MLSACNNTESCTQLPICALSIAGGTKLVATLFVGITVVYFATFPRVKKKKKKKKGGGGGLLSLSPALSMLEIFVIACS